MTNIAERELSREKKNPRCTCGLYRHESFQTQKKKQKKKQESAGRIPPRCTDVTVCCAEAAAAAAGLALEKGGSLSVVMKWKSSSAMNTWEDNWRFSPPKEGRAIGLHVARVG